MRKLVLAMALLLVIGIGASSASACLWDGYYGPGAYYSFGWSPWGLNYHWPGNDPGGNWGGANYQEYLKERGELRSSLAADQAELQALLAGPKPDVKQARVLSERIRRTSDQLRAKASALAQTGGGAQLVAGPMGYGAWPNYGWYCW